MRRNSPTPHDVQPLCRSPSDRPICLAPPVSLCSGVRSACNTASPPRPAEPQTRAPARPVSLFPRRRGPRGLGAREAGRPQPLIYESDNENPIRLLSLRKRSCRKKAACVSSALTQAALTAAAGGGARPAGGARGTAGRRCPPRRAPPCAAPPNLSRLPPLQPVCLPDRTPPALALSPRSRAVPRDPPVAPCHPPLRTLSVVSRATPTRIRAPLVPLP